MNKKSAKKYLHNKTMDRLKRTGVLYLFFKESYSSISYSYKLVIKLFKKLKYLRMSIDDSKENWRKELIENSNYGYTNWRKSDHVKLEDLSFIKNYLKSKSIEFNSILDIGSYDGYFTEHYIQFKNIYCADLFKESGDLIKRKYGENIEFVLLNGFNLKDIPDNSIDLIFSMDSLNRAPRKSIINYFREFNRVIRNKGELFIHIPSCYHRISILKGFTFISPNRLIKELNGFENITLNYDVSAYGPIVQARKSE